MEELEEAGEDFAVVHPDLEPLQSQGGERLIDELQLNELYSGYTVQFDHEHRIRLGEITADLTRLTALESLGQLYTLAWLLEMLLLRERQQGGDLKLCCQRLVQNLFEDCRDIVLTSRTHGYELELEEVRCLDLLMAAFRLRKP